MWRMRLKEQEMCTGRNESYICRVLYESELRNIAKVLMFSCNP